MISDEVRAEILRRLKATEAEYGVRILFAIESGSRAWGFASLPPSSRAVTFVETGSRLLRGPAEPFRTRRARSCKQCLDSEAGAPIGGSLCCS